MIAAIVANATEKLSDPYAIYLKTARYIFLVCS